MKHFTMPADFKKETIDGYVRLGEQYEGCRVFDTYGNITVDNCFGSGRNVDKLPKVNLEQLHEYVQYSKRKDIDFSYTAIALS